MDSTAPPRRTGTGDQRRRKIRRFVQEFRQREGHPPSQREIADALDLAVSPSPIMFRSCRTRVLAPRPRTIVEPLAQPTGPAATRWRCR
jgi:hypothetical protein